MNEQNKEDLKELKKFVGKSSKFNKFYKNIIENEKNSKLNIIDHEILKLKGRIETSKDYLLNNLNSPFANKTIELIEKAERQLDELNSLDEIKNSVKNIDELFSEIESFGINSLNLNEFATTLKTYLAKYISTEISQPIISQIELIEKTLTENSPENIASLKEETEKFINDVVLKYEEKLIEEQKRIAEEKRKEEERIAKEKREEEERIAKEKREEEEKQLQETFKQYKANNQFQKDLIRTLIKIPDIDLRKIKFSIGDRLIEVDFSINKQNESINFNNITIKNLNKNVFYKLIKIVEKGEIDFTLFEEKKWFDEISSKNFSSNIGDTNFSSDIILKNLEFKDFKKNQSLINNISNKLNLNDNEINGLGALLSFSLKNLTLTDLSVDQKQSGRYVSADYFDIKDFTLLDWGNWKIKNYKDKDSNLDFEVSYEYSDLKNVIFDKEEIIKAAKNYDPNNFNIDKDYKIFFNMINSLGSGITKNIIVKDLSANNYIGGAKV